jgi:uncharacterized protein YcbK (DUF882 family)
MDRLLSAMIQGQGRSARRPGKRMGEQERMLAFGKGSTARTGNRGARALLGLGVIAGGLVASSGTQDAFAVGETRSLTMVHSHTGESISITYKSGGSFDSSALEKLNWFLRDWRVDEPISMSPNLFDIVWHVYREVGATAPIKIMSAYRSPGTNAMLRRRSSAVAKESQHMRGNAMDIHIPGVSMAKAREIGLRLQRGGVGYYPSAGSPFIHLDVGSVRYWPRMGRDQLERIFPDGKTVHIPADGKPLANYEAALAEVQARGGSALDYATVSSGKSLWALLFGGGSDEEEDRAAPVPVRGRGRQAAATRVADARGARPAPSGVSAFAGGADNPMNPGVNPSANLGVNLGVNPGLPPIETARPVVVAALPASRVEPPKLPEPKQTDLLRPAELPKIEERSRLEPLTHLPLPPVRPRGAAFTQLVASHEPTSMPLPPLRPNGLGGPVPGTSFTVASVSPAPVVPAPALVAAVGVPLPPARPRASEPVVLPGVIRSGEARLEPTPVVARAYASVSAPLPPQRIAAASPTATSPVLKVQPPAPALDAGRANARGAGQRPLSIPPAVAAHSGQAPKAGLAPGFADKKYLPTLGFSGSFVREIDAAGGFRRQGQ